MALRKPRHALDRSKIWVDGSSPILRCANAADAGSSMSRETAAWMKRPICSLRSEDAPSTARPAAALASDGRVPSGHILRSRMPVMSSSLPKGSRSRSYSGRRRSSIWEDGQISSGSATAIDSRQTLAKRMGAVRAAQRSGLMARRITSLSNMLLPSPASTVTVAPLIPLLRPLRRKSTALATSWVSRLRLRKVSFSAYR